MTAIVAAVAVFKLDLEGIKVPFFQVNAPELQQIYRLLGATSYLFMYVFFVSTLVDLMAFGTNFRHLRATVSETAPERYTMYSMLGAKLVLTVYVPPVLLFIVVEVFLAPMVP